MGKELACTPLCLEHAHLRALVAPMAEEEDLLVKCCLVPVHSCGKPRGKPRQQLQRAWVGAQVEQPTARV